MLTANPSWLISPESFLQAAEAGTRGATEQQAEANRLRLGLAGIAQSAQKAAQKQGTEQAKLQRGIYESDRDYAQRLAEFGLAEAKQQLAERKADQPRLVHSASDVFELNPVTGELSHPWSKPKAPETETITTRYPQTKEVPAEVTRTPNWRLLKPWTWGAPDTVITNRPAIPERPPYSVTRKVPIGSPLDLETNVMPGITNSPDIEGLETAPITTTSGRRYTVEQVP